MRTQATLAFTVAFAILVAATPVPAELGAKAPDFTFLDHEAKEGTFYNYIVIGHKDDGAGPEFTLLQFITLTCPYCKNMISEMQKQRATGEHTEGIAFLTVDIDAGHGADDIIVYREQQGATWTFGVDVEGKNEAYGVGPVPASFIVDRNGYIVKVFTGSINATTLDGYFEEVVSASEEGAGDDKAEDLGDVLAHPFVQFLVLVLVISLAGVGWLMTVNTRLKGRLKEAKREKRKERLSDRPRKKKWD